jgi:hypothetical protein
LGARKGKVDSSSRELPRTAILADQSPEVVVAMMSFWRSIWLVSETPREWLANIAGIRLLPDTSVQHLFTFLKDRAKSRKAQMSPFQNMGGFSSLPQLSFPPDRAVYSDLRQKLVDLSSRKVITDFDVRFTMTLLEQDEEGCSSIFSESGGDLNIAERLMEIYDPEVTISLFDESFSSAMNQIAYFKNLKSITFDPASADADRSRIRSDFEKVSFLLREDNFKRARSVFLANQDFYAVTSITDDRFWNEVASFAIKKSASVTDVYLSCIPKELRKSYMPGSCSVQLDAELPGYMAKLPGAKKYVYDSTCGSLTPEYLVKTY